jgi:hypothetical protein
VAPFRLVTGDGNSRTNDKRACGGRSQRRVSLTSGAGGRGAAAIAAQPAAGGGPCPAGRSPYCPPRPPPPPPRLNAHSSSRRTPARRLLPPGGGAGASTGREARAQHRVARGICNSDASCPAPHRHRMPHTLGSAPCALPERPRRRRGKTKNAPRGRDDMNKARCQQREAAAGAGGAGSRGNQFARTGLGQ